MAISYSLLDENMTQDDKLFFQQLGKSIAAYRKELGLTQTQLAEALGISQQLIAAYEAGSRKVPASMLPTLSKLFAVSLEQLIGLEAQPAKRGPASTLQRQIEQISLMPRSKQKFIIEMLEALIQQQRSA
jgi:transcriptional regulator with XRE-family HTH domain